MRGKRGLSQIVTTVILIVLILAAVAGLWLAVGGFISEGSSNINLEQFTLGLSLKRVVVDYDSGLAEVRVKRDSGEGDLKSIKFIVEDDKSSEVFEEFFNSFPELAERTFTLDLTESEFLTLNKISKISIAPVYLSASGNLETGEIVGSIEGLNDGMDGDETDTPAEQAECEMDSECPDDSFLENSEGCNDANTMVTQTKFDNFCQFELCRSVPIYDFVIEDCSAQGKVCYNGFCIDEAISCTTDIECGEDILEEELKCHGTLNATSRDFKDFTCNTEGICEVGTTEQVVEMCEEGDICHDAECFTPLECTYNPDCCPSDNAVCGRVCNEGICEDEVVVNIGTISSAWPPGIGEYFDSSDLNTLDSKLQYVGYTLIFPGSLQTKCLIVRDFNHFDDNEVISYIRLSEQNTNISSGDSYELWETAYACSL